MVYDAETGARNAEKDTSNEPGYCQQQTRQWSGIPAMYGDAATAWRNTNDRHPGDKNPPRGAHVFWTGGSKGYGHAAMSLGNQQIRSTDAGGTGKVATRHIDWFGANWGLPYAGWAWDNNEVTIPHSTSGGGGGGGKDDEDMPLTEDDIKNIAARVNRVLGDYNAKGEPDTKDAEYADNRIKQIENVVRRLETKIDNIAKKI
jgi:hypothetical protein